jgi:hypothetical protein
MAFHLEEGGCKQDRACAFLHTDAKGANLFVELDKVAGSGKRHNYNPQDHATNF